MLAYEGLSHDAKISAAKLEFMRKAHEFDESIQTAQLQGPLKYENSSVILSLCDTTEDPDLKKIITIIDQNCFKLKFDNQIIIKTVYGLFDYFLPERILKSIRLISKHLADDELIVCHYLVKIVLQTCFERNLASSKKFHLNFIQYHAGLLQRNQEHKIVSMEKLAELKMILDEVNEFHYSQVDMDMDLGDPIRTSWIDEINQLIDSDTKFKKEKIRKITMELRSLPLELYKKPISREFFGQGWSKEEQKWHTSPWISKHTQQSNQISTLIAHIILTKETPKKRARAISLFIKVLESSFKVYDGVGPDFDTMMTIFGALSFNPIDRLTFSWEKVSRKSKNKWEKFKELLSNDLNYKVMREYQKTYRLTLPFLGLLKKDITALREINDPQDTILFLGEFHRFLQYLRENLSTKFIQTQTDLVNEVAKFTLDEDAFYDMSIALEPIKTLAPVSAPSSTMDRFSRYFTSSFKEESNEEVTAALSEVLIVSPKQSKERTRSSSLLYMKRSKSMDPSSRTTLRSTLDKLRLDDLDPEEDAQIRKRSKKHKKDN